MTGNRAATRRKINAQNRGKSKYKRISWDEATTIIANEIKRIQDKYGQFGVMTVAEYIHGESKNVHAHGGMSHPTVQQDGGQVHPRDPLHRQPGSRVYGGYHIFGTPGYPTGATTLDVAQNSEQLITFCGDWETNMSSKARRWRAPTVGSSRTLGCSTFPSTSA